MAYPLPGLCLNRNICRPPIMYQSSLNTTTLTPLTWKLFTPHFRKLQILSRSVLPCRSLDGQGESWRNQSDRNSWRVGWSRFDTPCFKVTPTPQIPSRGRTCSQWSADLLLVQILVHSSLLHLVARTVHTTLTRSQALLTRNDPRLSAANMAENKGKDDIQEAQ